MIYEAKQKRFKDHKYAEPFWLTNLVRLADQRKAYNEAAIYQQKYIDTISAITSTSSEMIASEQLNLAKYLVLAGKKTNSINVYKSAIATLCKTPHSSYLKRYVFASLIPLAEAYTKVKLLDQASQCLEVGFEANKSYSNYAFRTVYKNALDSLIEEYEASHRYEDAEGFLRQIIGQSAPDSKDELEICLANFQLDTSIKPGVNKSEWLSKATKTFEIIIARIQAKEGKDSHTFKSTVRDWVDKLDTNGYIKEAKLEENRLK